MSQSERLPHLDLRLCNTAFILSEKINKYAAWQNPVSVFWVSVIAGKLASMRWRHGGQTKGPTWLARRMRQAPREADQYRSSRHQISAQFFSAIALGEPHNHRLTTWLCHALAIYISRLFQGSLDTVSGAGATAVTAVCVASGQEPFRP